MLYYSWLQNVVITINLPILLPLCQYSPINPHLLSKNIFFFVWNVNRIYAFKIVCNIRLNDMGEVDISFQSISVHMYSRRWIIRIHFLSRDPGDAGFLAIRLFITPIRFVTPKIRKILYPGIWCSYIKLRKIMSNLIYLMSKLFELNLKPHINNWLQSAFLSQY